MKTSNFLMQIIALTALIATLGSLYFSELRGYVPCDLCWYQRIIMYPVVLLSIMAIIRKEMNISFYILVISGIGIITALYHYALQKINIFSENLSMCTGQLCTVEYINWFGFVTIPFLALIANIIIFVCALMIIRNIKKRRFLNGK